MFYTARQTVALGFGTNNYDGKQLRSCMASAAPATNAPSAAMAAGSYDDLQCADVILLIGAIISPTTIRFSCQRLLENPQATVIVADRASPDGHDVGHLPAVQAALRQSRLLNGMAHILIRDGLHQSRLC